MAASGAEWEGTTYGNSWMHRNLVRVLRHVNPRIMYVFSGIFVVPPAMFFMGSAKISYSMYRRRMGMSRLKSMLHCYMNHYRFSQVIIDRFSMYAGRRFEVVVEGMDKFEKLSSGEGGFVMLSSHVGSYETAGYSLKSERKRLNALVYGLERESVMENRKGVFEPNGVRMILTGDGMSHLFEVNKALDDGEIVSMPADRLFGSKKSLTRKFLGWDAEFPVGPFAMIRAKGCPVVTVNVVKESSKLYRIFVREVDYDRGASGKEQIETLCTGFVNELERVVRRYPDQWFNFYAFWKQ